ncbi:protein-arginine deiminase family protein [Bacteriovorax sp. PP10]|uniref:Protein-arginine deiminase family protein n=1 Tax=Bacteriovorax antarcticus TaxID=3088717 RepID=A0ABU5VZ43_9BACT|nr:protein-arginine deiminase family protein [Bacteriovorax sp. PP10]MEA9358344.1 protein-arginine deiminase family protein [Bacteriovorax sp. PP10]
MKKTRILTPIFLTLLTLPQAFALQCPQIEKAPLCPQNGITLLDETYPTQSFLISNAPFIPTKEARGVTRKFIYKIIDNYDYENVPQILISVADVNEFRALVASTKAELVGKKLDSKKIERIIDQMTFVPAPNYTWQQDWFESFVDLKTGAPVVRQIDSYPRVRKDNGKTLSDAGLKCNVKEGPRLMGDYPEDLMTDPRKTNQTFGSGEMGGNIEGAPGGFCLVGDNQGKKFTDQFCGDADNVIQLQTSWLEVGHVDEIFKIIPTQFNDGRPKECEFSLMAASPKKALELMKSPENGKTPFMDFTNPDYDPSEARDSRSLKGLAGNSIICKYAENIMKNKATSDEVKPAVKAVFYKILFGVSIAEAADAKFNIKSIFSPQYNQDNDIGKFNALCAQNIDKVSNFEIQEMMLEDPQFMNLNNAIAESIENDKAKIKSKILSRLPQCAKYYNELEVPNIFHGTQPFVRADGTLELPRPGTINSFLPNPTNSVLMNKTVTFPNTGNLIFNKYLKEEMEKKKMKADFISTWDYSHLGKGNIHCSSHSLPYCRPNTQGSK